jgi:transcriptional regulator of acetoin/glycerol metabolism
VRELENVIEFMVVRAKENNIRLENLPTGIKPDTKLSKPVTEFKKENTPELIQLLEKHKWNKTKAAEELGIGRTTLWRLLKKINDDN